MTTRKFISFPVLTILSLFFSAQLWAETDCSKEAIAYYLEKGFTPDQVSRMCAVPGHRDTTDSTIQQSTSVDGQAAATSANDLQNSPDNDELLFFNKTILSDSLTVTPETLTYIRDECVNYGEEENMSDSFSFQAKVCGVLKTTINRVGLEVLRAVKGIPLIRDTELLVKGEIQREVINFNSLNSDDQKTFEKVLDPTPETFDIQIRDDADPKEIAARLPR